jgi:hypothetical protein
LSFESKAIGSFDGFPGLKPPSAPMISERFVGPQQNPMTKIQKTIRESDFLGDSFSRYGLRDHRSQGNRDHRLNALNSSVCTEIIGDCPQGARSGAHILERSSMRVTSLNALRSGDQQFFSLPYPSGSVQA